MRAGLAVLGDGRPVVGQHARLADAQVDHRLDRQRHPRLEARTIAALAVVRNLRLLVQLAADAVPDKLADHRVAVLDDVLLHRGGEVAEHPAVAGVVDRHVQRLLGRRHQVQGLLGDIAGRHGQRIVADPALVLDADVHLDDVAVLDHARSADAVDDLLVDRDADVPRVLAVAEEGALAAAGLHFRRREAVHLAGGHADGDLSRRLQQDVAGHLAGRADALLLGAVADGNAAGVQEAHAGIRIKGRLSRSARPRPPA